MIKTSDFGETNVPGLFAAGDTTTLYRQVAHAVASGTKSGAWINRELLTTELQQRTDLNSTHM